MSERVCPVCGGDTLIRSEIEETIKEPFGGEKTVMLAEYTCEACGSTGDFFNENEAALENALSVLKRDAIANILEDFTQNKISLSSIERALELPQRTLTKWKSKAANPSSTGIALLKFLRVFPWLLDVAENKFDYVLSQKIHMSVALHEFLSRINFSEEVFPPAKVRTTANSHFIVIQVDGPGHNSESEGQVHQNLPGPTIDVTY